MNREWARKGEKMDVKNTYIELLISVKEGKRSGRRKHKEKKEKEKKNKKEKKEKKETKE